MHPRVGRLDPQQLLHLSLSNGSTLCIPYFLISQFTLCSHVFLGLPLPLHPWSSNLRHLDTQSSTAFLSTCPYQRNLLFRTTSATTHYPQATIMDIPHTLLCNLILRLVA